MPLMSSQLNRRPATAAEPTHSNVATRPSSFFVKSHSHGSMNSNTSDDESRRSLLSAASSVGSTAFSKLLKKMKRQENEVARRNRTRGFVSSPPPLTPMDFAETQRRALRTQREKEREARIRLGGYRMSLGSLRAGNLSTKRRAGLRHGRATKVDATPSTCLRSPEPQLMRPRSRFSMALGRHSLSAVASPAFRGPDVYKTINNSDGAGTQGATANQHGSEIESIAEADDTDDVEADVKSDRVLETDSDSGSDSDSDNDTSSDTETGGDTETGSDTDSSDSDTDSGNESDSDSDSDTGSESDTDSSASDTGSDSGSASDSDSSSSSSNSDRDDVSDSENESDGDTTSSSSSSSSSSSEAESDTDSDSDSSESGSSPSQAPTKGISLGKVLTFSISSQGSSARLLCEEAYDAEEDGDVSTAEDLLCLAMSYTSKSQLCAAQLALADFHLRASSARGSETGRHLRLARGMVQLAQANAKSDDQVEQVQMRLAALDALAMEPASHSVDGDAGAHESEPADADSVDVVVDEHHDKPSRIEPLSVRSLPAQEMRKISRLTEPGTMRLESMSEAGETQSHTARAAQLHTAAKEAEFQGHVAEAEELFGLALSHTPRSALCSAQLDMADFYLRASKFLQLNNDTRTYLPRARAMAQLAQANAKSDDEVEQVQMRLDALDGLAMEHTSHSVDGNAAMDESEPAAADGLDVVVEAVVDEHHDMPSRIEPLSVRSLPAQEMRKISRLTEPGTMRLESMSVVGETKSHATRAAELLTSALIAEAQGRIAQADGLFGLALSHTPRSALCLAQLDMADFYLRAASSVLHEATLQEAPTTTEVMLVGKYLRSARGMATLAQSNAASDGEVTEAQARVAALDAVEASLQLGGGK